MASEIELLKAAIAKLNHQVSLLETQGKKIPYLITKPTNTGGTTTSIYLPVYYPSEIYTNIKYDYIFWIDDNDHNYKSHYNFKIGINDIEFCELSMYVRWMFLLHGDFNQLIVDDDNKGFYDLYCDLIKNYSNVHPHEEIIFNCIQQHNIYDSLNIKKNNVLEGFVNIVGASSCIGYYRKLLFDDFNSNNKGYDDFYQTIIYYIRDLTELYYYNDGSYKVTDLSNKILNILNTNSTLQNLYGNSEYSIKSSTFYNGNSYHFIDFVIYCYKNKYIHPILIPGFKAYLKNITINQTNDENLSFDNITIPTDISFCHDKTVFPIGPDNNKSQGLIITNPAILNNYKNGSYSDTNFQTIYLRTCLISAFFYVFGEVDGNLFKKYVTRSSIESYPSVTY